MFLCTFSKITPEQHNLGPQAYLSRDAVPVNIIWSILNGEEPSSSFRDHCSPWNPYSGPHSKTQCVFVVIEMSELSTDKHPAASKPLSLFCGMAVYLRVCVCVCVYTRVCFGVWKKGDVWESKKKENNKKTSVKCLCLSHPSASLWWWCNPRTGNISLD